MNVFSLPPAVRFLCALVPGAGAALLLGGAGVIESLLFGAVFALWCRALFNKKQARAPHSLMFGAGLFLLFAARMAVLPVVSPDCQDYLLPWAEAMSSMTFREVMLGRVGDYTVLYQYFVFLLSRLPQSIDLVAMYKLLSISFESLLAYSAASLACLARGKEKDSLCFPVVFLAVLALPTVFLNGAYWSQCDAVFTSLSLFGVLMILKNRPNAGCACLALSLCLKLQAIFILPVCALLLFHRKLSIRHAFTAAGTVLLVSLPALLAGKGIKGVLGVYLYQMGEYKQLVLDAPTLYQFLPETASSKLGILLAGSLMCVVLLLGALRKKPDAAAFTDACFALCIAIPFFLPHMHERYFYLADVLAVCYAAAHPRRLYAPVIVLLGSLNGYCAYLFKTPLTPWSFPTAAMALLVAASIALLARDAAKKA
ncbi:MAG: hypothetical protein IKV90_10420 [Clostridia bacterium]|nr:hypothetical protein [Clostridia bacterium]